MGTTIAQTVCRLMTVVLIFVLESEFHVLSLALIFAGHFRWQGRVSVAPAYHIWCFVNSRSFRVDTFAGLQYEATQQCHQHYQICKYINPDCIYDYGSWRSSSHGNEPGG